MYTLSLEGLSCQSPDFSPLWILVASCSTTVCCDSYRTNQRTNDFMQPCNFPTVEVTIKDYVMFQIVFATLHQVGLSTGGVKCYARKLYHPPQYMVNMILDITMTNDDISNNVMTS